MTKNFLLRSALIASMIASLPLAANARAYLLPSNTTFDKADSFVTIDASASDDLFNLGRALPLENLAIETPGNVEVKAESAYTTKQRSSFELKLPKEGTYKIALLTDTLSAMYKVNGDMKRWRGTKEAFAKEVPADAQDLNVSRMQSRIETYVTAGKASTDTLKASNLGLEMVPVTAPTEIYNGDTTTVRFLLDGKPAQDLMVSVIRGGNRYRDALGEVTLKTDKDGKVAIKWQDAGMYSIGASIGGGAQPGVVGTLDKPIRRVSYSGTLEVLQP
jgi:hypothetical protein